MAKEKNRKQYKHQKERKLQCQKCKHKWTYKGENNYYACCPHCKSSVKIPN